MKKAREEGWKGVLSSDDSDVSSVSSSNFMNTTVIRVDKQDIRGHF